MSQTIDQFFTVFKTMTLTKLESSGFVEGPVAPLLLSTHPLESWDSMTLASLHSSDTSLFLSVHYNIYEHENLVIYHDKFRELTNIIAGGLKGIYKINDLDPLTSTLPGQTFGFLFSMLQLDQEFPAICRHAFKIGNRDILVSLAMRTSQNSRFHKIQEFKVMNPKNQIEDLQS